MPPSVPFQGNAFGLSSDGLARVSSDLGVHASEIWTVVAVETSGCGFLADGRPQILYERHIFHRLTQGRYDDGDIRDPKPRGNSGATGWLELSREIGSECFLENRADDGRKLSSFRNTRPVRFRM